MSSMTETSMRFGRFELQPGERRLLVDGVPSVIGGISFDLLLALAERPGKLVGKHALMDIVWPGLVVQENNLAAQVSALRKVLGGDLIATVPGRGYRLVAPLQADDDATAADTALPRKWKQDSDDRDRPPSASAKVVPPHTPEWRERS
jgi:DNA-binding winged helix-turn-helix (wHTH) protein